MKVKVKAATLVSGYVDDLCSLTVGDERGGGGGGEDPLSKAGTWMRTLAEQSAVLNLRFKPEKCLVAPFKFATTSRNRQASVLANQIEWDRTPVNIPTKNGDATLPRLTTETTGTGIQKAGKYLESYLVAGTRGYYQKNGFLAPKPLWDKEACQERTWKEAISRRLEEEGPEKARLLGAPLLAQIGFLRDRIISPLAGATKIGLRRDSEILAADCFLRRYARTHCRAPGFLGNGLPAWALHTPARLWGLGLPSILHQTVVAGCLRLSAAMGLPLKKGQARTNPGLQALRPFYRETERFYRSQDETWKDRVAEPLKTKICQGERYPSIKTTDVKRVIPQTLLESAKPITAQSLAGHTGMCPVAQDLSCLITAGAEIVWSEDLPDEIEGVKFGELQGKRAVCETTGEVGRILRKFRMKRPGWGKSISRLNAFVQRAKEGLSASSAAELRRTSYGQRAWDLSFLGLVTATRNQPIQGSYRWAGDTTPGSRRANTAKRCFACGKKLGPRDTAGTHIFAGKADGQTCKAMRGMNRLHHNHLLAKYEKEFLRKLGYPELTDECVRSWKELAASAKLMTKADRAKATTTDGGRCDLVIQAGLEAWIVETSVTNLDTTRELKRQQVARYAAAMRAANGVPDPKKTGFIKALWTIIGSAGVLVRLMPRKGDGVSVTVMAPILQKTETYMKRQKVSLRESWNAWMSDLFPILVECHERIRGRKLRELRVVYLTTPKLMKKARKAFPQDPRWRAGFVAVQKDTTEPQGPLLVEGARARAAAMNRGLAWPGVRGDQPRCPPLTRVVAVHPVLALYDQVGTAYPETVRDFEQQTGENTPTAIGAQVVKDVPAYFDRWRQATSVNRRRGKVVKIPASGGGGAVLSS